MYTKVFLEEAMPLVFQQLQILPSPQQCFGGGCP